jgi:magnesium-transporting ATPase (P-type)
VLIDDDFSSIVQAVRLGRRIFDNLKKAMVYILAIHVSIAGLSLLPVLFNWPLVLSPIHIAFLELIVDPACSIVFEAEPRRSRHDEPSATQSEGPFLFQNSSYGTPPWTCTAWSSFMAYLLPLLWVGQSRWECEGPVRYPSQLCKNLS